MIDKRLVQFIILMFFIFNSLMIFEIIFERSKSFEINSNGEIELYNSNQDHIVKIIINVQSLNGTADLHFFDWDVISSSHLHLGINGFSQSTNFYSISVTDGSSITGTYLIQDSGPDLGFGSIIVIPISIIIFFIIIGVVLYDLQYDFVKISNFLFIEFNTTILFAIPCFLFNVPFISYIFFGPLSIIPFCYMVLLIIANITFIITKRSMRDGSKFNNVFYFNIVLGLLSIVYGMLIFSSTVPIQFFGHLNIIFFSSIITSVYFVVLGSKIVNQTLVLHEHSQV